MFVKKLLYIKKSDGQEITTELGDNFSFENDFDTIAPTLTFSLPYDVVSENEALNDFTSLARYNEVKFYYKEFDEEPGVVSIEDLHQVFGGYITNIKLNKSRANITYEIQCFGILGLSNEKTVALYNEEYGGINAFNLLLQRGGLQKVDGAGLVPQSNISSRLSYEDIIIKWDGGKKLSDIFSNVKDKYGIRVNQLGDEKVVVWDFFGLISTNINIWNFDYNDNVSLIDYGDLTQDINLVAVIYGLGTPDFPAGVGIAVDPTNLMLKKQFTEQNYSSIEEETISLYTPVNENSILNYFNPNVPQTNSLPTFTTETINFERSDFSQLVVERRDIYDQIEAETVAKNLLLENIKSKYIILNIPFNPLIQISHAITLTDGDKFNNQKFIIKKISANISKTDVSMIITCVNSGLGILPESFITSPTGITDLRVLEIEQEVTDAAGWNSF